MRSYGIGVFFFLFLTSESLQAQEYRPLVTHTKEWLIKTCVGSNCLYDYYYLQEDTVINNLPYKFLHGYHYNKNFMLRENRESRQVFLRIEGVNQTEDYLLYDFSLQIGETIFIENPISPASGFSGNYILDSISTKNHVGIQRRHFYLSALDSTSYYPQTLWIEGIGSTSMINAPGALGDSARIAELLCVHENGDQIYHRNIKDTCFNDAALSAEENINLLEASVWFADNKLNLRFSKQTDKVNVAIYNTNGMLVFEEKHINHLSSIDLPAGLNGIYIVSISDGEEFFTQKMRIQTVH